MAKFPSSIRQKITLGYYTGFTLIIGVAVLTYTNLMTVENKIIFSEKISGFFETILEIRRFEKNYFLYKNPEDYDRNIQLIKNVEELLQESKRDFSKLASFKDVNHLEGVLKEYKKLMEQYHKGMKAKPLPTAHLGDPTSTIGSHLTDTESLELKIRDKGKDILTIAERILIKERSLIQHLLSTSRNMLLISLAFLVLVGMLLGQALSRMVVKPLRTLEKSIERISEGCFEPIFIESSDREIKALNDAFKKMCVRISEELELRQRQLIRSEKLASLGTLLSGVAHELNNPLSNISSSCQILMEEVEGADVGYKKELLAQIEEQTDRARNIVRSLLEFSRDKEFKKDMLMLKNLFEETIKFVKGQVPAKIEINIEIPDDIFIFANKQRVQQAFLNLIKNAIESIPDGGSVFITAQKHRVTGVEKSAPHLPDGDFARETESPRASSIYHYLKYRGKCVIEGNTVDIEIRDTGIGIPPEILPRIFDPFFTTKDVGMGSGLGLFIVYEIIEEHDGCIAVDSEPGKGTTFLIRLPLMEI